MKMWPSITASIAAMALLQHTAAASSKASVVSIPAQYTYLLPGNFTGDPSYSFANGTSTTEPSVNNLLADAAQAPFISFDDEFLDLLGPNPTPHLIEQRSSNFAGEAGVWIKERGELWYTTWINDGPTHIEILNLTDNSIRRPNISEPTENPNGGFYHQGLVYFSSLRVMTDNSSSGGVVSVDPETGHVEQVLNSYMGLNFDSIDDVAWVTQPGTNKSYMYITILPFTILGDSPLPLDRLPQGIWRFDPQEQVLLPVISRTDLPVANGVRPSPDQKHLYVTDFGGDGHAAAWGLPAQVGSPSVYKYDLDDEMYPVNRRVIASARMQAPDGVRVDNKGRLWTGEGEGVVVRNRHGKVIGIFNAQYFTRDAVNVAIVQFALAGDALIILGQDKLWRVKLAEMLVTVSS